MTLVDLAPGQTGRVSFLDAPDPLRRRLADLGLIENTAVSCLGASPLGDPRAFGIRGAVIALRRQDQAAVHLRFIGQGGDLPWA